jgi:hypothetical protein
MIRFGWVAIPIVLGVGGCDLVFPPSALPQPDAGPDAEPCPADYNPVPGAPDRYKFIESPRDWRAAEDTCLADSVTDVTHLVVFQGWSELDAVRAGVPWPAPWDAWTGYARNSFDPPDMFTAVTGEPLSPVSNLWEPGEPTGTVQAVRFDSDFDLSDAHAATMLSSICECDGRRAVVDFDIP